MLGAAVLQVPMLQLLAASRQANTRMTKPTAAGTLAARFTASLKESVEAHGFAPVAVDFDKADWAHRGKVLNALTERALERLTGGGELRVVLTIGRKILGLSTAPQGLLNAQRIARHLSMSDRAVRDILNTLTDARLVEIVRDGQDIQVCRIHPDIFRAAREGQFAVGHVDGRASDAP